ncbi:TetR/AcrR family transcriptional regulator [Amycolatopsis taiwanensis]|uniref:TetR family transcriptional regulator n=1 Tax=Amycolatopsis taiwanensis TaxID=342230 RepID=A0A9W6VJA9_9PSEU|nr:TetR/AcrR family transcriptional regulator [Amycolatopsis taiwanensis]GLY69277.1 TetR family transcriptional regulator [Amycolatopsis taiwanensis]
MLRELRKSQTRQAISDVATRLFIEHGFEEVTIAEVAAAAKVAKMTVTNHFPRKEDLVFDVRDEFVASLVGALNDDEPVLECLRRHYFEALARRDALIGFTEPGFARMILTSPTLLARLRELHEERENALSEALSRKYDPVVARAVAAQLTTAYRLLFQEVLRCIADGQPRSRVAKAVNGMAERVFDLLASGLAPGRPK